MGNSKPEDMLLGACASFVVLVVGVAMATLLYGLITAAVPLVESMMSRQFMATGF
jgi:hypothetical protein